MWGSELVRQGDSSVAGMTQSSVLDQHCPDHNHPSQGPPGQLKPYRFCIEENRSPLNSQPLSATFSVGYYLEKSDVT